MDKNHYMFGLSEEQAKNCKKCAIIENQSVPRSRKDSLDISEELMNAFINPGGAFYEFTNFQKTTELVICFKGKEILNVSLSITLIISSGSCTQRVPIKNLPL